MPLWQMRLQAANTCTSIPPTCLFFVCHHHDTFLSVLWVKPLAKIAVGSRRPFLLNKVDNPSR